MELNDIVTFKLDKQLTFVKRLGKGGTGEVYLFQDKEIDKYFAIKKFAPPPEHIDDYYLRFKNEVKILIDVYHPNIVRCYTYYLFPQQKAGYLQMEYIQGETIDKYLERNPRMFDKMFMSALNAFEYLEDLGVLHRDIRPSNFLVQNDELKIIDFGFGKEINSETITTEFLHLNWPVTIPPEEIEKGLDYDCTTEVYYLGSMFRRLLDKGSSLYSRIIDKMCQQTKKDRYYGFTEAKIDAISEIYYSNNFDEECKRIYLNFADELISCITVTFNSLVFRNDEEIMNNLENNLNANSLEEYVSNNANLIQSFFKGNFKYRREKKIKVEHLRVFYKWMAKETPERRSIVFLNIKNRISNVENKFDYSDDLPF